MKNANHTMKFTGIALALGVFLALTIQSETLAATGSPALVSTFAASELSPHDTWRVYLKGSDPDGDLKFVHVWLNVPGAPTTPVRFRVDRDQRDSVSGYLTLPLLDGGDISNLFGPPFHLYVTLEDRAGNRSETAELPLSFYLGAKSTLAPGKEFENRFLGRIPGMHFGHGIGL